MNKTLKMGKTSAVGSFQVFVGKLVSTVILAIGTIIIGMFISDGQYGLYTIALVPATTLLLFQDWGISSAMTKYCASYRELDKASDLRKTVVSGLAFLVIMGLFLTVLSLTLSSFIALTIFNNPDSAILIALLSLFIVPSAIFNGVQYIFVGFERMGLNALMMVGQALVYCICSSLLVYFGYGALGIVLGYLSSYVFASIIGITLLYSKILREIKPVKIGLSDISQTLRLLLRYGIPLGIANILVGILPQIYYFLMAAFCDIGLIGNYKIATNFAVLLTLLTFPISTVLFPAFSRLDPKKEKGVVAAIFTSSVKYTALFLVPATMALMVLSGPLIGTLYADKWPHAAFFLTLAVIGNIFAISGNLTSYSFLTGFGETRLIMKLYILTLSIGLPAAFLLIPQFGIIGLIFVTITAGVPSMFIGLYWVWKHYGVKADFSSSAKILLASTLAATVTYIFQTLLFGADWIMLALGALLFLVIYLVSAPVVGAVSQTDVENLRAMFSGLGLFSKLLEIPLTVMEKPLKIRLYRSKKIDK